MVDVLFGFYEFISIYRFSLLTLLLIVFFIIVIYCNKKKKNRVKKITAILLSICIIFLSCVTAKYICSPEAYEYKINMDLIQELEKSLDNCDDISKHIENQQIINQQIIVEYDTIQMAKEQYTDYKAMAIMGYGDSLSSTYSTDKIIVYCSPIVYDKGNMFLPLFEYEMYYVNMYIVYGNYLIKITGTANTLLLTYHSIDETLKKIILILE